MDVKELYSKVRDFEERIPSETRALSQCQKGCARCCYTDISVFQVEADSIKEWFKNLSSGQKEILFNKWKIPPQKALNFFDETVSSCPFLHEESCTIYEARPLICRTQGLGMAFKIEGEQFVDICPLNESTLEKLQEADYLNLDLLNMILAQLEKLASGEKSRDRVKLSLLRDMLWTV